MIWTSCFTALLFVTYLCYVQYITFKDLLRTDQSFVTYTCENLYFRWLGLVTHQTDIAKKPRRKFAIKYIIDVCEDNDNGNGNDSDNDQWAQLHKYPELLLVIRWGHDKEDEENRCNEWSTLIWK